MSSIEFSLLIILILITAINYNIYERIKQKYSEILRQLWRWESYIKENYNASRSEIS